VFLSQTIFLIVLSSLTKVLFVNPANCLHTALRLLDVVTGVSQLHSSNIFLVLSKSAFCDVNLLTDFSFQFLDTLSIFLLSSAISQSGQLPV
jgi:hypothetical protein